MARLLLDEHLARSTIAALADDGHDVAAVADIEPGASDRRVLILAREQARILITFDADFGELVFQQGEDPPPAILYLRLHPNDPRVAATVVIEALRSPVDDCFVVCTREGTRRRALPRPDSSDGRH